MAAAARCSSVLREGLGSLKTLIKHRSLYTKCVRLSPLTDDFNAAKDKVSTLTKDPGNDVKLKMYALFKQGSQGKCTSKKPGALDFVNRAKWMAWNDLGDLPKDEAQKQYISLVQSLLESEGVQAVSKKSTAASDFEFEDILVKKEDGVFTIQLNRPQKYNAITYKMYEEWGKALDIAGQDDSVVTMVTGSGDYFCSGNDLSNFTNIPEGGPAKMAAEARVILREFVAKFIDFPKPLIAAINGPAVGISVTTLGLYDLAFATDKATFHTPFSSLGQSPEGCSSYLFPKIMGNQQANEVLLAGRKLTAMEAKERGLINDVFPHDDFWREVNSRVTAIAKLPPKSLRFSKKLIRDTERARLHEINEAESELLEERWISDECMQAIMQFMTRKQK